MKRAVTLFCSLVLGAGLVAAVEQPTPREPNQRQAAGRANERPVAGGGDASSTISRLATSPVRTVVFTAEREAAARTFVRNNRPEMEPLLDELRRSKPDEYRRVICDLFRTSEQFANLQNDDRARYQSALKIWQTEAKTHLLAAELASKPAEAESLKAQLRATIEELATLQIQEAADEVRAWEAKLRRAESHRQRLEAGRGEFVERRIEAILAAVGRQAPGAGPRSSANSSSAMKAEPSPSR